MPDMTTEPAQIPPSSRQHAQQPPAPTASAGFARFLCPLGALAFYCAIVAVYVIGTGAPLRTKFIGDGGDNWQFVWNAWWLKRCLLEFSNPYFCPLQFAPGGVPLTLHNLVIAPTLVMVALGHFLPTTLAYNLTVLSFFPVAGLTAYALARHITREYIGAVVGGALFMLCPFLTSKTLGHMNLLSVAFLPLYTLCLLRALENPTRLRRILLTAVFLLIVFSNEHTLVFAANVTVWLWAFRSWRGREWKAQAWKFWKVLKPAVLFSIAWSVFLAYYAVRYGAVPYRTGSLSYCPEPLNFILPLFPTSIWRDHVVPPGKVGWDMSTLELAAYLGWLVLPLAIAGYRCMRSVPLMKFMGVLFVCSLILAQGPKLQWHREAVRIWHLPVYLPMELYAKIPVLGSVGQSGRYLVIGYMAMAVAVAGLIQHIRARRGIGVATGAAALALVLIGADYGCRLWFVPVPACPIPPGSGRVMDVRENRAVALHLQTIHGRPLVGGCLARWPKGVFKRYQAVPGIGWFFTNPKRRGLPPTGPQLRSGLHALDVEYVCADRGGVERQVLENAGLELVNEDSLGATFRVPP